MNNVNANKGFWIGIVAIVVIAALGWWWIAANQQVNVATTNTSLATSTAATTTSQASQGPTVTDKSSDTVKSILTLLPSASEYESLLSSTGVGSSISATGQYTIFVPTDSAFSSLPKGTLSKMTAAQLRRLVQYSIVAGKAIQPGAQFSGVVQAWSGDPLNFTDINNIPMVNSSIIIAEYKGSNGVVYLINEVLLPPQKSNV
ncbi:MAG: fasciclin domain-containing protein [Candidatus Pacebacteria bacterium]|nr:fasciclin domain-containing protein [Candidatus Paceibacterota bacterium]